MYVRKCESAVAQAKCAREENAREKHTSPRNLVEGQWQGGSYPTRPPLLLASRIRRSILVFREKLARILSRFFLSRRFPLGSLLSGITCGGGRIHTSGGDKVTPRNCLSGIREANFLRERAARAASLFFLSFSPLSRLPSFRLTNPNRPHFVPGYRYSIASCSTSNARSLSLFLSFVRSIDSTS